MSSYDEHLISQAGGDGDVLDQIQRRVDNPTYSWTYELREDRDTLLALVREQAAKLEAVQLVCSTIENLTVPQAGQNWHITGEKSAADKIRKALEARS